MAYQLTIPRRMNEGPLSHNPASLTKGARDLNREFSVEEIELTSTENSLFRPLVLFFQIESFVSLTLFHSAIQSSSFFFLQCTFLAPVQYQVAVVGRALFWVFYFISLVSMSVLRHYHAFLSLQLCNMP